jgi:hypothetical protein
MSRTKKILLSTASNQAGRTTTAAPDAEPSPEKKREAKPVALKAYTIPQFCEAYNMSIWTYYRIAKDGIGPKIRKVGHKTLIGVDDAEAWFEEAAPKQRRAREAAAAAKTNAEAEA